MSNAPQYNIKDASGNIYGPADIATLRQWITEGRITANMLIGPVGSSDFQEARTYSELADLFAGASPTPAASTAVASAGVPTSPYQQTPQYYNVVTNTQSGTSSNGMAIASLILSICGLFCCVGSIVGIILGFVALNQAKTDPNQTGKGLATAGNVVGFCMLVINIGIGILYAILAAKSIPAGGAGPAGGF